MIEGNIKDIKELDRILSEKYPLIKDSSNKGSKVYTKIYQVSGNPLHKRIRIFMDERDKRGTIKVQDYYPCLAGVCTFILIQMGTLVQESIQSICPSLL